MDLRPPFAVTGKILKAKTDGKSSEAPKTKVKEPLINNREKRVFGTVRNQNAVAKAVTDPKPARKAGIPQKSIRQSINPAAVQQTDGTTPQKPSGKNSLSTAEKKSAREKVEENKEMMMQKGGTSVAGAQTPLRSPFFVKPRKKSVNFSEKVEEIKEKVSQEGDFSGTPLRSPFLVKSYVSGTPYHSAERCSKCRFDKLETSPYWLGQIRLAESVGKHFVSAAFFKLASECNAEPIRNIKVELKKYLGRHQHLYGEKEWTDLCVSYGLMEENQINQDNQEEGTNNIDQDNEEAGACEEDTAKIYDDEEKQVMEEGSVEAVNE